MDLNTCSSRQLTAIPGIDKTLADAIIRYRHTHGRYKNFDELWKLTPMTRMKYQILKRHVMVSGERAPPIGSRLPFTRLSLTESMVKFVCKGQQIQTPGGKRGEGCSVSSPSPIDPSGKAKYGSDGILASSTEGTGRGKKRSLARSAPARKQAGDSSERQCASQKAVQSTSLQREKDPGVPYRLTKDHNSTKDKGETLTASNNQAMVMGINNTQVVAGSQGVIRNAWAEVENPNPVSPHSKEWNNAAQPMDHTPTGPSITLQSSPSGNNINFSCTINRRFLDTNASIALKVEDKKGSPDVEGKGGRLRALGRPKNKAWCEEEEDKDRECAPEEGSQDQESEYATALMSPECKKPGMSSVRSLPVSKGSSSNKSNSSPLSVENLFLFEKQHRLNNTEKRELIESWVLDVNGAGCTEEAVWESKESPRSVRSQLTPAQGNVYLYPKANNKCVHHSVGHSPREMSVEEGGYPGFKGKKKSKSKQVTTCTEGDTRKNHDKKLIAILNGPKAKKSGNCNQLDTGRKTPGSEKRPASSNSSFEGVRRRSTAPKGRMPPRQPTPYRIGGGRPGKFAKASDPCKRDGRVYEQKTVQRNELQRSYPEPHKNWRYPYIRKSSQQAHLHRRGSSTPQLLRRPRVPKPTAHLTHGLLQNNKEQCEVM